MNAYKTYIPRQIGSIHIVGIGGIGMSGIAEVLLSQGFDVQGSDSRESDITKRLERLGARIHIGQSAENLDGADVVVISSAIKPGNPELDAALEQGIPVVRRAEMLAEIMRLYNNIAVAGTHGKTTTTSLVAAMTDALEINATIINGGVIQNYGSNARIGDGDWMVVEADESDGTFNRLPVTVAVITNIDPEHLDYYGSYDKLLAAFENYASSVPFYGAVIACLDHAEIKSMVRRIKNRRITTYGFDEDAMVRIVNLGYADDGAHFDLIHKDGMAYRGLFLPMFGDHNVQNAAASVAVGLYFGASDRQIRDALSHFKGVKRRFNLVGRWHGITIVDDYAHHPVEVESAIRAARQATKGRVVVFHQPHRYSRLESLWYDFIKCFDLADVIAIGDVYSAGESPVEGIDAPHLVEAISKRGTKPVFSVPAEMDLVEFARTHCEAGDLLLCCGAGSVSGWANTLEANLGD